MPRPLAHRGCSYARPARSSGDRWVASSGRVASSSASRVEAAGVGFRERDGDPPAVVLGGRAVGRNLARPDVGVRTIASIFPLPSVPRSRWRRPCDRTVGTRRTIGFAQSEYQGWRQRARRRFWLVVGRVVMAALASGELVGASGSFPPGVRVWPDGSSFVSGSDGRLERAAVLAEFGGTDLARSC